jgi:hypothetical protein
MPSKVWGKGNLIHFVAIHSTTGDIFKNRIEKLKDNVYGIGYGFGDEVCGDAEELLEYFEETVQL